MSEQIKNNIPDLRRSAYLEDLLRKDEKELHIKMVPLLAREQDLSTRYAHASFQEKEKIQEELEHLRQEMNALQEQYKHAAYAINALRRSFQDIPPEQQEKQ